jgi:hypothetical protein
MRTRANRASPRLTHRLSRPLGQRPSVKVSIVWPLASISNLSAASPVETVLAGATDANSEPFNDGPCASARFGLLSSLVLMSDGLGGDQHRDRRREH